MPSANDVIRRLDLAPHPEGGWFRETHRSDVTLPQSALPEGYDGDRAAATSILFLLKTGEPSVNHRVLSEEIWLHQGGDDVRLTITPPSGEPTDVVLGRGAGAVLQHVVPPGWWQAATPRPGEHGYVLVGCVVAPGFDFDDFQMQDVEMEA